MKKYNVIFTILLSLMLMGCELDPPKRDENGNIIPESFAYEIEGYSISGEEAESLIARYSNGI